MENMKPPIRVEVDRSGTLMRVTPRSDSERAKAELSSAGLDGEELAPDAAAKEVAAATSWYTRANIHELSREEFRTLARRWAAQVVENARLTSEQERRLVASLDGAMDEALASIPLERGEGQQWADAKLKARDRVLEEGAAYLQPSQLAELRETLEWAVIKVLP
jgi:hypothetical protein